MTKAKQKHTLANGTAIEKIGNAVIASSPNGHTAVWNDTSNLMNGVTNELSQTANSPITIGELKVRMLDLLTRAMPASEHFDEGTITISKESIMIALYQSWTIHAMFDGENYDLENGILNVSLDDIGPDTRSLTIEEVIEECESILDEYENKLKEDKKNWAAK